MFDKWSRLARLNGLRTSGALSEEEFAAEKAKALAPRARVKVRALPLAIVAAVVIAGGAALYASQPKAGNGSSAGLLNTIDAATTTTTVPIATETVNSTSAAPLTKTSFSADDIATAFAVAFGSNAAERDPDGSEITFEGAALVPVQGATVALVSLGQRDGGANGGACHVCTGKLRVDYLQQSGDTFAATFPKVKFDETGNGWGEPPNWRQKKGAGLPSLKVTTSYSGQGCTETGTAVLKLTPAGVVRTDEHQSSDCSAAALDGSSSNGTT